MQNAPVRFGSVCSGIEAASVAFSPLGWKAAWFSEIEEFPSKVLAHHYPEVTNHGDMTLLPERILSGEVEAPDVLCGGTPCQAFSVAGLRKSLGDARGNLSLTFCEIANAIDTKRREAGKPPAIVLWENVPGVINTDDNAFGCLLGALAGEAVPLEPAGGKWSHAGCVFGPERAIAWRVLDAQHFGVPQRRKRVFLVACPLERAHPTSILFEFEGMRRDSAPSRPEGQGPTASLTGSTGGVDENDAVGGLLQPFELANCLTQRMHKGINTTLDEGHTPVLAFAENQQAELTLSDTHGSLKCGGGKPGQSYPAVLVGPQVRKLMPVECERLMGFPDDYTNIPKVVVTDFGVGPCAKQVVTATIVGLNGTHYVACNHCDEPQATCPRAGMPSGVGYELCRDVCKQQGHAEIMALRLAGRHTEGATLFLEGHTYACDDCIHACADAALEDIIIGPPVGTAADTPRYKALGNSWAVPVVRWIGTRINAALEATW